MQLTSRLLNPCRVSPFPCSPPNSSPWPGAQVPCGNFGESLRKQHGGSPEGRSQVGVLLLCTVSFRTDCSPRRPLALPASRSCATAVPVVGTARAAHSRGFYGRLPQRLLAGSGAPACRRPELQRTLLARPSGCPGRGFVPRTPFHCFLRFSLKLPSESPLESVWHQVT
jgi:hypothetical protein